MTYVVAGNSLGAEGGKALASALPHLVQLTSLSLRRTYCVDVDVDCVFGRLALWRDDGRLVNV